MDYYAILGLDSDANEAEIRRAFRGLARRYHPDAGAGSSPEKFRAVQQAYETLGDPLRRRAYDRSRRPVWRRIPVESMTRDAPVYDIPVRRRNQQRGASFEYRAATFADPLAAWDDMFDRIFEDFFRRW